MPLVAMMLMAPAAVAQPVAADSYDDASAGIIHAAEPNAMEALVFYIVAGGALLSAIGICVSKNIVRMAVWLFLTLGSVAMLYFLLAATFLAAIQLIVYVGGTLVLLIFGVMLTSKSPWARFEAARIEVFGAVVVVAALMASLWFVLTTAQWDGMQATMPGVSVEDLGRRLLTTYVLPFEAAGVVLFVVMVGAAHLARERRE